MWRKQVNISLFAWTVCSERLDGIIT